jgi:hypothetical protein
MLRDPMLLPGNELVEVLNTKEPCIEPEAARKLSLCCSLRPRRVDENKLP